jgi:hypothetical protein
MTSFIGRQSSIERLGGLLNRKLYLGADQAGAGSKEHAWLILGRLSWSACRAKAETSARSFKNPAEYAVLDPTGLPLGLSETPGFHLLFR